MNAPAAAATVATSAAQPRQADTIRDTIDSIVVAFILAFVFRAFIVEAFIIPTGSMGPTLYGLHGQTRCENCAYPFVFNLRPEHEVIAAPQRIEVVCPNCTYHQQIDPQSGKPFLASTGDRILVLKWPYDIGIPWLGPQRWDVVVFKDPNRENNAAERDGKTNFIKRLIGLPAEVLEIIDGDIYAAAAKDVPQRIRDKLDPAHREPLNDDDLAALNNVLKIQRKTPVAQSALWMIHSDNDYRPPQRPANVQGYDPPVWAPIDGADGWKADQPQIRFDGRDGAERFIGLAGKPIRDSYGYNSTIVTTGGYQRPEEFAVGDVRVEFVLDAADATAGHMALLLTKDDTTFIARIRGDGQVQLFARRPARPGYEELLKTVQASALAAHRPVQVAMENVDYRVSVEIDGRVVIQTNDTEYKPDLPRLRRINHRGDAPRNDRTQVRIGGTAWAFDLSHVRVMRDVFYESAEQASQEYTRNRRSWATGNSPILLRPGEFFVCGDNSPQSADSRLWSPDGMNAMLAERKEAYQAGTVPADQMIGRAFFVYWPAGRRLVENSGPPVVPNAGRMRMIR